MDNRTIMLMTIAVLVGVALLLMLNVTRLFHAVDTGQYLSRVEIRGITLVKDKKDYALSYDQQSKLVALINKAIMVKKAEIAQPGTPPNFDKIVIMRFNQPDLTILPVKYIGEDLVFAEPSLNPNGWLKDTSHGELKTLITQVGDGASNGDKPFLSAGDVTGASLIGFDNNEQKLNASQTRQLVTFINKSTPIDKLTVMQNGKKTPVEKIMIRRSNGPAIEVLVIAYMDNSVIISEPTWSPQGLLKDNSDGSFKELIEQYL